MQIRRIWCGLRSIGAGAGSVRGSGTQLADGGRPPGSRGRARCSRWCGTASRHCSRRARTGAGRRYPSLCVQSSTGSCAVRCWAAASHTWSARTAASLTCSRFAAAAEASAPACAAQSARPPPMEWPVAHTRSLASLPSNGWPARLFSWATCSMAAWRSSPRAGG